MCAVDLFVPHHYDFTEKFFEKVPAVIDAMSEENKRRFAKNGAGA